jgi:diacylglycerol kinase (ATP)
LAYQNARGLQRLINAFGFSIAGLRACFEHEEAFRQEVWLMAVLLPLGLWLGDSGVERAILVGSALIVPIVELLNSAIEANVDRVGMERHQLSKRAKDIASAAVFLSIVFAVTLWALVLAPRFF